MSGVNRNRRFSIKSDSIIFPASLYVINVDYTKWWAHRPLIIHPMQYHFQFEHVAAVNPVRMVLILIERIDIFNFGVTPNDAINVWYIQFMPTNCNLMPRLHYSEAIMATMASQITSLTVVYSTVQSGINKINKRKYQSSASQAFVQWIHRSPVNSRHKWPVKRKIFQSDEVIMMFNNRLNWHEAPPLIVFVRQKPAP